MDDQLSDFNPATSHLRICRKERESEYDCNRQCIHRLYDVAVRTEALLNPKPITHVEGVDGPVCGSMSKGQPCALDPGHVEAGQVEHEDRDSNRWPAHRPWSPSGGYGS